MRQVETDFVEINLKKDGKKWFSGTPFISMYCQGRIENYVPTIYQSDSSSNPMLQQRAAHKLLSKSYRAVIQRFWTLCLLSASLPFLPFLSPSSTVILPSSGDSAPLWCLKNFLSRREHTISHGKKGKPFRKRDMELSPFLYLVMASGCWSQPRNVERGHILLPTREQSFIPYKPFSVTLLCRLPTRHVLSYQECIAVRWSALWTSFLAQEVAKQCAWLLE